MRLSPFQTACFRKKRDLFVKNCITLIVVCFQGNDVEQVKNCLATLHGKAATGIVNRLRKVYELEQLAVELFAHITIPPSKASCIDMLTSNTWDYESDTK